MNAHSCALRALNFSTPARSLPAAGDVTHLCARSDPVGCGRTSRRCRRRYLKLRRSWSIASGLPCLRPAGRCPVAASRQGALRRSATFGGAALRAPERGPGEHAVAASAAPCRAGAPYPAWLDRSPGSARWCRRSWGPWPRGRPAGGLAGAAGSRGRRRGARWLGRLVAAARLRRRGLGWRRSRCRRSGLEAGAVPTTPTWTRTTAPAIHRPFISQVVCPGRLNFGSMTSRFMKGSSRGASPWKCDG